MEKYFKAEAKAEEKLLEKSGEGMAEGFLFVYPFFLLPCLPYFHLWGWQCSGDSSGDGNAVETDDS